jgi:hypothetical protein
MRTKKIRKWAVQNSNSNEDVTQPSINQISNYFLDSYLSFAELTYNIVLYSNIFIIYTIVMLISQIKII